MEPQSPTLPPAPEVSPVVKKRDVNWLVVGLGVLLIVSLVGNGLQAWKDRLMQDDLQMKNAEVQPVVEENSLEKSIEAVVNEYGGSEVEISDDLSTWTMHEDPDGVFSLMLPKEWALKNSSKDFWESTRYVYPSNIHHEGVYIIGPTRAFYREMCMPMPSGADTYPGSGDVRIEIQNESVEDFLQVLRSTFYVEGSPVSFEESIELVSLDWGNGYKITRFVSPDRLYGSVIWIISNENASLQIVHELSQKDHQNKILEIEKVLKTLELK